MLPLPQSERGICAHDLSDDGSGASCFGLWLETSRATTENFSVDDSWLSAVPHPSRPLAHEITAQEKEFIESALAECKGRVSGPSGAAARLGMPASTLDSKIRALKIDKRQYQAR